MKKINKKMKGQKKPLRLFLSGDHAGFKLKKEIKSYLAKRGYIISDFGPLALDKNDDYPDFVLPMAQKASQINVKSIVIAGSGTGEAIAANKVTGIRAGLYHGGNPKIVKMARAHDDINVLCMGARFVDEAQAKKAIDIFLITKFDGGRHRRRLNKIENYSKK